MGVRTLNDGSQRGLLAKVAVVVAAAALTLAACGSSSSGGTSSSAAASTPAESSSAPAPSEPASSAPAVSGDPVVTYTITDLDSQGPVYANIQYTAQAYEKWVNENGGIAGRPLKAVVCDGKGTPEGSAACARKAVDDKAVAVVGSFTFAPDAIVDVLEPAGIAYFGACCPLGSKEFQSKIVFTLGSHQAYGIGFAKKAAEDKCQKINMVVIGGAEGFAPIIEAAAAHEGITIMNAGKPVVLPPTAQDYSAQVAAATKGDPDCLFMVVSETPYITWMKAWSQSGSTARMYGPQGNFDSKVCTEEYKDICAGGVVVGAYPDFNLPVWDTYRGALAAIGAPDTEDYNSLGGLGTWTAYGGFSQVADKVGASVDAASFLKAAETATVSLPGQIPDVDFTKPWKCGEISGYFTRLFNRSVVYAQWQADGTLKDLSNGEFDNVSALVEPDPLPTGPDVFC